MHRDFLLSFYSTWSMFEHLPWQLFTLIPPSQTDFAYSVQLGALPKSSLQTNGSAGPKRQSCWPKPSWRAPSALRAPGKSAGFPQLLQGSSRLGSHPHAGLPHSSRASEEKTSALRTKEIKQLSAACWWPRRSVHVLSIQTGPFRHLPSMPSTHHTILAHCLTKPATFSPQLEPLPFSKGHERYLIS